MALVTVGLNPRLSMSIWPQIRLRLRSKLLLVSLVLLLLPWLGVRYIQAVEDLLQQEQAHAMATIAKASAILVSQYPTEFTQRLSLLERESGIEATTVMRMPSMIQVDGYQDDWLAYRTLLKTLPLSNQLKPSQRVEPQDISARYLIAQQDQSLVVLLDVVDDSIVFRDPYSQKRHGGDAVIIAMVDQKQRVHRYILTSSAFGALNAYEYIGNYQDPVIIQRQMAIKAVWQRSPYGYRVEFKFPLKMTTSSIALSIVDMDQGEEGGAQILGLGDVRDNALFSTLLLPSLSLANVLSDMTTEGVRLWLVDSQSHIIASAGQGAVVMDGPKINSIMDLFYQLFLKQAVSDDESLSHEQAVISGNAVVSALKGQAQTERRKSGDGNVMIVASQPVTLAGVTVAAVVAEQNTNAILGLQNQAVTALLNTTLLVFVIVVAVLIGFASRLSFRIRRLNRDVSSVITGEGKVTKQFSQRVEYDELGELRQGFEQMFEKLAGYTYYLEALASRLAHELRTPIAVIRTSLEHLENEPEDKSLYIERARTGSERLNNIVARMSEASRLEQTVNSVSLVEFDLTQLLNDVIPAYQDLYSDARIALQPIESNIIINGSQELVVQMLDKLISNAVDFHQVGTAITLSLKHETTQCILTIRNTGVHLPEQMSEQLFQPMVSIRQSTSQSSLPHLGLGLYIVQLIAQLHKGYVEGKNWQDGVEFCVALPIIRL